MLIFVKNDTIEITFTKAYVPSDNGGSTGGGTVYMNVRKILALTVAAGLLAGSLCGCGAQETSNRRTIGSISQGSAQNNDQADKPVLQLTIASNQTSQDNPYHFGLETFKEVAEELSEGTIQVTCSDGTPFRGRGRADRNA